MFDHGDLNGTLTYLDNEMFDGMTVDELRDAFPVHIVVEKVANGSMVTLR